MPTYMVDDFEYVTLTDAEISNNKIIPTIVSGSVMSEYIDLTPLHVGDVAITIDGYGCDLYYATNYDTEWKHAIPTQRTEYILTAFDGEFSTEYDIAYIENIQTELDYRNGEVLNPSNLVGFARVGYSSVDSGLYTESPLLNNIFIENNYIKIYDKSLLPARSNIAIAYTPMIPVLSDVRQHLILKVIFKSMYSYLNAIKVDFKLDTYVNVLNGVPAFYRRV